MNTDQLNMIKRAAVTYFWLFVSTKNEAYKVEAFKLAVRYKLQVQTQTEATVTLNIHNIDLAA